MTPAQPQDATEPADRPSPAPAPVPSATERREAYAEALRHADDEALTRTNFYRLTATYDESAGAVLALADAELAALAADRDAKIEALQAEVERMRRDVERYRPLWSDPLAQPIRWRDERNPHPRGYISTHEVLEDYDGAIRCASNWTTEQRHAALDRTMGHVRPLVYEVEHLRADAEAAESRARAAEGELRQVRALADEWSSDAEREEFEADHAAGIRWTPAGYFAPRLRAVLASVPDETTQPATTDEAWVDRHGDVWLFDEDGIGTSHECANFSRKYVEKKWGPLRPASPVVAPSASPRPHRFPATALGEEALAWKCEVCKQVISEIGRQERTECPGVPSATDEEGAK